MKKMLKFLVYLGSMLILLILFMPKVNLYYALEELMADQNIYLSNEKTYDRGLSLEIENADILFDKLSLAKVDTIKASAWVIANGVKFSGIHMNEGFSDFFPGQIDKVQVIHWLHDPTRLKLRGESAEGLFYGEADLLERTVLVHIRLDKKSEKKYRKMLNALSKEEGGYFYEYKF